MATLAGRSASPYGRRHCRRRDAAASADGEAEAEAAPQAGVDEDGGASGASEGAAESAPLPASSTVRRGAATGRLIALVKEACRSALLNSHCRLALAIYHCEVQIDSDALGKMYGVIARRQGRILRHGWRGRGEETAGA